MLSLISWLGWVGLGCLVFTFVAVVVIVIVVVVALLLLQYCLLCYLLYILLMTDYLLQFITDLQLIRVVLEVLYVVLICLSVADAPCLGVVVCELLIIHRKRTTSFFLTGYK